MRFRPRYSLLTLLILTALVAGGIVYFRIPHRNSISLPPIADQQQHLDDNFFWRDPLILQNSFNLEYDYVYTLRGQRWLSLAGKTMGEFRVYTEKHVAGTLPQHGSVVNSLSFHIIDSNMPNPVSENVVAWVIGCEQERPKPPVSREYFRPGMYLLTDRRSIWRIDGRNEAHELASLVTISEIPDEHVRQRLKEELAKIPELSDR